MSRFDRAAVVLVLGIVAARLLWSGSFGWFVQQRMQLPLLVATVVLLVLGLREALVTGRRGQARSSDDHVGHHHDGHGGIHDDGPAPRVGWMLALPVVVLLSVAPTGLGAAAADRVDAYTPGKPAAAFQPLDTSDGPVELRVYDFLDRAIWDETGSLRGTVVRLEGLVVNDPDLVGAFRLTRFAVSCCAADGIPMQVVVHDPDHALPDDTWVVADVVWRATSTSDVAGDRVVEADARSVTVAEAPDDPYEAPYGS